ncbi:MAG TPA: FxDxF family PEP-CTERM protein [Sphingomonas sp.]|nr:FxDxF family PEP-CTERM protein [Sphingomonas sp.]
MGAAGLTLAAAFAPAAYATAFTAADMSIVTNGDGTISAKFGNSGIAAGDFTDTFSFTIAVDGLGSGAVTTSTSSLHLPTDLDILWVTVNGLPTTINIGPGLVELAGITNVPITAFALNVVTIHGHSYGNASYGANVSFIPLSTPETGTWAMMVIGFGMAGSALRARRRSTKIAFG